MTWVAAGTATLTAAEIAAAEAAAAAAATAAAEAAAAQTASTALVAEAAPALTQTAATVLPEATSTLVPEATGILEAAPGVTPPPAEPMTPAGIEQITPAGSTPTPPAEPMPPAQPPTQPPVQPPTQPPVQPPTSGPQTWSDMPTQAEGFSPADSTGPVDAPTQIPPPSNVPTPETNPFLQGVKDVGSWMNENKGYTAAGAYMGLQSMGAFNQKTAQMPEKKTFKNQYSLSPNFQGGPYSQPNVYKPSYAAGGITQINGPVERMSANALGGNTNMYPQSQQERTNFATPTQMPVSAEVTMNNEYSGVTMAQGGIARFANEGEVEEDTHTPRRYRGNLTGTLDKYNEMIEGKKSGSLPSGKADPYTGVVGTFEDSDIDTRLQDPYTAALTRLKKTGKRANYDVAALPAGIQAGALNMPTRQAAGGGIMQANLGGYAAGGNPRLLSGPGDGMSDNIPATISGRQPARLADGEFVVPADVVSHLGNGSTNAGAKKLHGMMDKVRVDRTGKKKQAPAVKAGKYIPK